MTSRNKMYASCGCIIRNNLYASCGCIILKRTKPSPCGEGFLVSEARWAGPPDSRPAGGPGNGSKPEVLVVKRRPLGCECRPLGWRRDLERDFRLFGVKLSSRVDKKRRRDRENAVGSGAVGMWRLGSRS